MNNEEQKTNDTRFKAGPLWTGNKSGRPKGSKSLKTYVKEMLEDMTDDEKLEFLGGIDKRILWEMAEGKADTKTDITSKGERVLVMPVELINKNATDTSTEPNSQ